MGQYPSPKLLRSRDGHGADMERVCQSQSLPRSKKNPHPPHYPLDLGRGGYGKYPYGAGFLRVTHNIKLKYDELI